MAHPKRYCPIDIRPKIKGIGPESAIMLAVIKQAVVDLTKPITGSDKKHNAELLRRKRDAADFLTNRSRIEPFCVLGGIHADRIISQFSQRISQ